MPIMSDSIPPSGLIYNDDERSEGSSRIERFTWNR